MGRRLDIRAILGDPVRGPALMQKAADFVVAVGRDNTMTSIHDPAPRLIHAFNDEDGRECRLEELPDGQIVIAWETGERDEWCRLSKGSARVLRAGLNQILDGGPVSEEELAAVDRVAGSAVTVAFKNRTGHGGAPAIERHVTKSQLLVIVKAALLAFARRSGSA